MRVTGNIGREVSTAQHAAEMAKAIRAAVALEPERFGSCRSWEDLHAVCDANEFVIEADAVFGEVREYDEDYFAFVNNAQALTEVLLGWVTL